MARPRRGQDFGQQRDSAPANIAKPYQDQQPLKLVPNKHAARDKAFVTAGDAHRLEAHPGGRLLCAQTALVRTQYSA
eukprot:1842664-Amphidinium_carterae.1